MLPFFRGEVHQYSVETPYHSPRMEIFKENIRGKIKGIAEYGPTV